MQLTDKEYSKFVKARTPASPVVKDTIAAFLAGGALCCVGQGLGELYALAGMAAREAGALVSVTLIFISAVLTAFGVYDSIAKVVGAGIVVPITGFANSIVSPAMEFRSEGLVPGLAAKMFVIAGPVLVYGVAASVVYGILVFIF